MQFKALLLFDRFEKLNGHVKLLKTEKVVVVFEVLAQVACSKWQVCMNILDEVVYFP